MQVPQKILAGTTNEDEKSPKNFIVIPTTVNHLADADGTKKPSMVKEFEAQAKEATRKNASDDTQAFRKGEVQETNIISTNSVNTGSDPKKLDPTS